MARRERSVRPVAAARRSSRVVVILALSLAAAACGDDGDERSQRAGGDAASASRSAADSAGATVQVSDTELGRVLVDRDGMTLYLFTMDAGGTPTCEASCAELWPPLVADGDPTAGENIDEALLGTVERPDGSPQVTYGGHPLYRYAPDSEAGDVSGHGVNDVWFAVTPAGDPADDASPPSVGY